MNAPGPLATALKTKLEAAFSPQVLIVEDESALHAGHAGAPGGGESHFRVRIVSSAFKAMPRVERQRRVYAVLKEELAAGVHALALVTLTPEEAGSI